ncbi:sodium:solute symporter [Gilvimarinus sp. F26214L]|uniref:sodium:solute symporter n=1 Tax=Gilvimarinus sp. DZF01 TaxID=3461371 RepID=UPI00404563BC
MNSDIRLVDWLVIGTYLAGLIAYSVYLSRTQHSRADYYLGSHKVGALPIAISTMATQVSTNSILGAPAFVAFASGGGLVWLQYELALPLAMLAIMVFLLPMFHSLRLISVYEYLERRFDLATRLSLSAIFQLVRVFATAVTVYSIGLVIQLITGLSFFWSVMLLGAVTLVYDVFGGVRAVIYSDVIQMVVLFFVLVMLFALLLGDNGGFGAMVAAFPAERLQTLDFANHGLGDGATFAFWPMLFGGFFLYVSYYGCDQSQVQRELCAKDVDHGKLSLLLNGMLRFPLVLLYCFVGVGIGAHALANPDFVAGLPLENGAPNYNVAVPLYMLSSLPAGVLGLGLIALFAAAMSSLDSVINSLSAVTMEDFVRRFHKGPWSESKELFISRLLTLAWGSLALAFSFYVGSIADTVLEAINMIGSLINGPVLGVFALGLLTRRATGAGAIVGLLAGFLVNVFCWVALPKVSWLWWNVFGFVITFGGGYLFSMLQPQLAVAEHLIYRGAQASAQLPSASWRTRYSLLALWSPAMLLVLFLVSDLPRLFP